MTKEKESRVIELHTFPDQIGEILFYDGSFRLALSKDIWDSIRAEVINLIEKRMDEDWKNKQDDKNKIYGIIDKDGVARY